VIPIALFSTFIHLAITLYKSFIPSQKKTPKNWNGTRIIPNENIIIKINLDTILPEVSTIKFFKFKTIKKIIEIEFLNESNLCPIFIKEIFR
jgi:hypothetical protein